MDCRRMHTRCTQWGETIFEGSFLFHALTYLCFFVCLLLICPFGNWHLKYNFREHFGVHSNNTNFRIMYWTLNLWTFGPVWLFVLLDPFLTFGRNYFIISRSRTFLVLFIYYIYIHSRFNGDNKAPERWRRLLQKIFYPTVRVCMF